jgi:hypothetical protein
VIWVSKLQTEIALSTTEAEYIALSQSMRDLLPMRELLIEISKVIQFDATKPAVTHSTIFEDNNGAIALAQAPRITPRTKHIAVKYHHFRSKIGGENGIHIAKIATDLQRADILTKGLGGIKFESIRRLMMGW